MDPFHAVIKTENFETILHQIHSLLNRAFRLSSTATSAQNVVGALLLIKNDVEAITTIFDRHKHIFLQPRVHLYRLNGSTVAIPDIQLNATNEKSLDGAEAVKIEPSQTTLAIKQEQCELPAMSSLPTEETSLPQPFSDDDGDGAGLSPPSSPGLEEEPPSSTNDTATANGDKPGGGLPEVYFVGNYCKLCKKKPNKDKTWDARAMKGEHMKKLHPEKVFICQCGVVICDQQDMDAHVVDHPNVILTKLIQDVSCPVCGLKFLNRWGNLTKEAKYFLIEKGDENFVTNHLTQCHRRRSFVGKELLNKCKICRQKYQRQHVYRHMIEKHAAAMLQCQFCGEWYDKQNMSYHIYRHHNRPQRRLERKKALAEMKFEYSCALCQVSVVVPHTDNSDTAKRSHMMSHHSNQLSRCVCGVYVSDEDDKEAHLKEHPEMQLTKLTSLINAESCSTCGLQFVDDKGNMTDLVRYFWFTKKDEKFLESHLKQCLGTRAYRKNRKCRLCKNDVRRYLYWKHITECHKERVAKCEVCGEWHLKRLLSAHRLRFHKVIKYASMSHKREKKVQTKREDQSLVCPTCGESFTDKIKYQKHKSTHKYAIEKARLVKCQYCGEMVPAIHISSHELYHIKHDGKIYTCGYCGKKYPYKTYYKHVRAHEFKLRHGGSKRTKCEQCGKDFTDIKMHIERMHRNRERHECKQCGKTFAEVRFLQRHETLHTKSFAFNCSFCGKGYNVKCALEYHVDTVHTKVKRYKCKVPGCGESFFVNLYLRRHMQRVHPEPTLFRGSESSSFV